MSFSLTLTGKHELKCFCKEKKCISEEKYNRNHELNRNKNKEFKATSYLLKQSRKGHILNLTKYINRASNTGGPGSHVHPRPPPPAPHVFV